MSPLAGVCLQEHCWSYILRNWHLLQRTPAYKVSIPVDQRQRLATDVKQSLCDITTLDSPGDQSQSMGFSVLWDASNTQPEATAALTPDGKRPVSKATEKRRQRLAEEQEQRRQEEEKRMVQQRRQQTVREIRQRQAAAAAEAAGRAAPSSAVQSGAENDPFKRAVEEPQQSGVGQRAAGGQRPTQARAGQKAGPRRSCQASLSQTTIPAAAASRKPAPKANGKDGGDTQGSGRQRHVDCTPGLRASSQSGRSLPSTQRSSKSRACLEGGQRANGQPSSIFRPVSGIQTAHHGTVKVPQPPTRHPSYPTSEAGRQGGGQQP